VDVILAGWAGLPIAELGQSTADNLKRELIKTPKVPREYEPEDGVEPVEAFVEENGFLGVPRQFFMERAQLLHRIADERVDGYVINQERCAFLGSIGGHPRWEEQTKALQVILDAYSGRKVGGIVQAAPAFGKTALAIRAICAIGRKTLVVVHKEFLAEQWKQRIEKMAPYMRVGIWQGSKEEIEDKDVVIGLVQTIANRDVSPEVVQQFGFCIYDEVHRTGARTWSAVPPRFSPRFNLGLSARPKRVDGMDDLIRWLTGPVIYKAAYVTPVPRVHRISTPYQRPAWIVRVEAQDKVLTYSTHLKAMVGSQTRNIRIVDELERILRAPNGRKVVVMSERVAHLDDMAAMLRERDMIETIPDLTIGFYHSKIGKEARQDAEHKRVIFSTFQMLEEGFDISALDTLVMTTARANVEQPVGRIRRECVLGVNVTENECKYYCPWRAGTCKSKPKPIVVEFIDEDVAVVVRKIGNRTRYYREMGAEVLEAKR